MLPTNYTSLAIQTVVSDVVDNSSCLEFIGKEVTITGKLHSSEHEKYFDVQDAKLQLYKEKKNPDKLHLSLNGQNIIDWFKEQFNKVKQTIKPHISPAAPKEKKGRGI